MAAWPVWYTAVADLSGELRVKTVAAASKPVRVLIALLLFCFPSPAQTPQRLLWITIDTLRADHLQHLGYERETAPWLEEFARQSADFHWAFAPSNVTPWSVSAFFTGRYSRDLVDSDPPLHLPRNATTVAELFKDAGFKTTAFVANGQLRHGLGFEQGFDEYHVLLPKSVAHATIDEVIYTIRTTYEASGGPEFIYLHTMDVHAPWQPPMPYDALFAPQYTRGLVRLGRPLDVYRRNVLSSHPYHSEVHSMNDADTEMVVSQYDGLIRYTDARLASMLDAVNYDPDRDMVIITSDHGEAFFEHGYLEHGRHLFPEETRVPLLIRGPGVVPGPRLGPVSLLDLLPTIAEVFGFETPQSIAGVSLLDVLQGRPQTARYVISEHSHRAIPAAIVVGEGYLYRMNGMAHFRYPWRMWPFMEGLYDLTTDPGCTRNLIDTHSETADRLNAVLRAQNPKFAPYTRERLAERGQAVRLGPNLAADWYSAPGRATRKNDGVYHMRRPGALLLIEIEIAEPGHAHLIEVEYKVTRGALRMKFQDRPTGVFRLLNSENFIHDVSIAWDYPVHKTRDSFKTVRAVVYPWKETMYYIAAMEKPGEAEVRSVQIRRAYVPEIPGVPAVPPPPDPVRRSAPAVLTEEWKARLDALGYVQ